MHIVITALWISTVPYLLILGQLMGLQPPSKPDFWICDHPYYGSSELKTEDCVDAVRMMPQGHDRVLWHNRNETLDILELPFRRAHGKRDVI